MVLVVVVGGGIVPSKVTSVTVLLVRSVIQRLTLVASKLAGATPSPEMSRSGKVLSGRLIVLTRSRSAPVSVIS